MKTLTDDSSLDALPASGPAILLKHGATCPISAHARDEVASFAAAHPELPVFGLEVTGNQRLSGKVAEQLGVRHESPQVLVLRDGKVAWQATHYDITADELAAHTTRT